MKKLLAYFMAFLMSMKTSTAYTPAPEKDFTMNNYNIEALDPPDYRDYYYGAEGEKVSQRCNLTLFSSNGKRVDATKDPYWFVDGQNMPEDLSDNITVKDGVLKLKGLFNKDDYIIAPNTCKLKTHSKGSDGKYMRLTCTMKNDVKYRLTINNMGGWYCDVSRTGKNLDSHTGEDQYNTTFRAGQVLGFATKDTTISIEAIVSKNNSELKKAKSEKAWVNTLDQFFAGKWGVDKNDTKIN